MINKRRLITAVFGAIVFSTSLYAGMMPMSLLDDQPQKSSDIFSRKTAFQHASLPGSSNCLSVADLDLWSVEFSSPDIGTDAGRNPEIQPPQSFTDGPSSISLCLSALMGLGLCASTHWVKRLHFGSVPEWFHDSGPFQIGHSHAATPESICFVQVCCFTQPVCTAENHIPQYRMGTIVSLWRKSQFTPAVIASRGPPLLP